MRLGALAFILLFTLTTLPALAQREELPRNSVVRLTGKGIRSKSKGDMFFLTCDVQECKALRWIYIDSDQNAYWTGPAFTTAGTAEEYAQGIAESAWRMSYPSREDRWENEKFVQSVLYSGIGGALIVTLSTNPVGWIAGGALAAWGFVRIVVAKIQYFHPKTDFDAHGKTTFIDRSTWNWSNESFRVKEKLFQSYRALLIHERPHSATSDSK